MQKMMVQSALLRKTAQTKIQQPLFNMSKRQFSSGNATTFGQKAAFGAGGLAITGITYLNYQAHQQRKYTPRAQQLSHFNPIVQTRIANTFGYFAYACGGTAAITFLMRNNMRLLNMSPWAVLALSMGSMIGTQFCDYHNNWALKNLMFTGFIASMSVSMLPLIHMYATPVIFDALIATGVTVGALGTVAYNAPSE